MKTISWFSAGVSSAVATKLAINEIDEIFYVHINDQHYDSIRFLRECEEWFGKKVTTLQSHYADVESVCRHRKYISGPAGAPCTVILKKNVRKIWEGKNPGFKRYVWGVDCSEREQNRADRIVEGMPNQEHLFPLIDHKHTKEMAHEILNASGIKRPILYEQGFHNNNCVGCVKGGMGYWNLVRKLYPEVFASRAKMERDIGASCINGTYLDELDPESGRHAGPIVGDCGILCELMSI
jgi:3'-phosphoadenosine 5'-phosphosulfate sulfotransferase (PAPS reductase)/FAD synthetase